MSSKAQISAELTSLGFKLVGEPIQDSSQENRFHVFIEVSRDVKGSQDPSNFKINTQAKKFEQAGFEVAFVLIENEKEDIQASIRSILFRFYPDIVRNSFLSFEKELASVWIEPKKTLSIEEKDSLTSKVKELLQVLETPLEEVRFTSTENVPTRTACLNSIRLKSPVTQEELQSVLIERGFSIPSEGWLSKMLDGLRRSGLILRKKNGQFTLTLSGLNALGSGKGRRSPDIARLLDLSRRGA